MSRPHLRHRLERADTRKRFLFAAVALVLAAAAISVPVIRQSRAFAQPEIAELEAQPDAAKRAGLEIWISIARIACGAIHGTAAANDEDEDEDAEERVLQFAAAMIRGQDGFYSVHDCHGTNLAAPREAELIGRGWSGSGLRNVTERMDQPDGALRILSSRSGTPVEAEVPRARMLPPESDTRASG